MEKVSYCPGLSDQWQTKMAIVKHKAIAIRPSAAGIHGDFSAPHGSEAWEAPLRDVGKLSYLRNVRMDQHLE